MIIITGKKPEFNRIQTGWFSFDNALADQEGGGYPLGQILEIYGTSGVGKTTIVHSLAGILAKETKSNITIADLEGINTKLMLANLEMQGFDGEVNLVQDKSDELVLQGMLKQIHEKDYSVGILDAIGSISPVMEQKGDLTDANMGRRAMLMSKFSRRANHILLNDGTKNFIMINHQHPNMGGFGNVQPGGKTKGYVSSIRIVVYRMRRKNKEELFKDGSYVIRGKVEKNRWGFRDREFYLFVLAGKGVHQGLTAMYNAVILKLATAGKTITIGDTSFGKLSDLTNQAQLGNDEFFQPFHDVLHNATIIEEEIEEEEEENE